MYCTCKDPHNVNDDKSCNVCGLPSAWAHKVCRRCHNQGYTITRNPPFAKIPCPQCKKKLDQA